MRLRRHLPSLGAVLLLTLSPACSHDEPEEIPEDRSSYTVVESVFYTPDEFAGYAYNAENLTIESLSQLYAIIRTYLRWNNALLDGKMREKAGSAGSWGYHKYILNYRSIDAAGDPVALSELVIIPEGVGWTYHPDQVVLSNHYTHFSDAERPTGLVGELLCGIVTTGAAYICPDLEGYGSSVTHPHPFMNHDLIGRQSVDGLLAALDLFEKEGLTPSQDFRLYNAGYSQGGSNALAVHREIETRCTEEQRGRIHLVASYCGGGAYSPLMTMQYYLGQETLVYPCILILSINSMIYSYPDLLGSWTIEDFVTPEFRESGLLGDILGKQLNSEVLSGMIYEKTANRLSRILAADLYDADSPKRIALEAAFGRCELTEGWTPRQPVRLYHATGDGYVPYSNATLALSALGGNGTVTLETLKLSDDSVFGLGLDPHLTQGGLFVAKLLMSGFE